MCVYSTRFEGRGIIHRALKTRAFAFFDRLTMATAIIFQWWRSKLRVYILYADTYGQILARARCVYGWKLWNFLLCAASSKMDEMVLWTFECSMPDWISFCVIGFLFARLCNFRFGIYIYTDWSV